MSFYKPINLLKPEWCHFAQKYEISIKEAYKSNFDRVIRNVKSQKCIKMSLDSTVILYGDNNKSKRFGIHWLIIVNAKPELTPKDIFDKKWHVLHEDKVFENHHPDNLFWSLKQKKRKSKTTAREARAEDGNIYGSLKEARESGYKFKKVICELDDEEYWIRTGVFNQLARETGFEKFRKIRVTSSGRVLMHDGRLIAGTASYSGKQLLNKRRYVYIGGKSYPVVRLIAMAKYNKVLSPDAKIECITHLDDEGLEKNLIEYIKLKNN